MRWVVLHFHDLMFFLAILSLWVLRFFECVLMLAKSLSKLIDLKFFFLELAWYEILLLEATELNNSE